MPVLPIAERDDRFGPALSGRTAAVPHLSEMVEEVAVAPGAAQHSAVRSPAAVADLEVEATNKLGQLLADRCLDARDGVAGGDRERASRERSRAMKSSTSCRAASGGRKKSSGCWSA